MKHLLKLSALIALVSLSACEKDDYDENPSAPQPQSAVIQASGSKDEIITQLDVFRALLGDSVNTTPGKVSGRREVNWDGVPANFTNNNQFPLDFFNLTDPNGANGRKRGLVYLNTGSPIRLDSSNFAELDASYADEFIPFSQKKSLISANSTVSEIVFKIAGTNTDAFVHGFGLVFLDVDVAKSTSVEFFAGSKSLGVYNAPVRKATGGFSFLGVHFPTEKVTRVKIIAGNGVLAQGVKDVSDGGSKDLVAFDDFFYDEPKSVN